MEIWILIGAILAFGFIGCTVIEIYEKIQMNRWMRQRHMRELKRAMRSIGKVECARHTLPDGKVEKLGPSELFVFDKQKVGTVTGTSLHRNEGLDAAEKLIKEAKESLIRNSGFS